MLEFQYFDGCPNAEETLRYLKELVGDKLTEEQIKITEIKDIAEAEELNFQGSPTILFNGVDIYTELKPISYNYSCRVYVIDGKQTGILDKDFIIAKIERFRK